MCSVRFEELSLPACTITRGNTQTGETVAFSSKSEWMSTHRTIEGYAVLCRRSSAQNCISLSTPTKQKRKRTIPVQAKYSTLLKLIIQKSYNGNRWVFQNCDAMSESEKLLLSLFIAIQVIRTRSFRDNLGDMFEKIIETMAYKSQMDDEDASPKEAFHCEVDPEYVKLQHSAMIIDPDMAVHFAETFAEHVWVVYYNKTDVPFYTSDSPVVSIPHKSDAFRSYAGFASEGIEIAFPLSRTLLLCMYDRNTIGNYFRDRQFYETTDRKAVEYYNTWQVLNSYRCVFAAGSDFLLAKKMCEDNPELQKYQPSVEVM